MCKAIVPKRTVEAVGEFLKGNEPAAQRMPVVAMQCGCGEWFVRVAHGERWVAAEPVPAQPVAA